MKVGIMGGFMFGGLVAGAVLGLVPGAILVGIGAVIGCWQLVQEKRAEAEQESWRAEYPPYGY